MRLHISCIHVVLLPPAVSCQGWLFFYIFTGIIPLFFFLRCIINMAMIPGQLASCSTCYNVSLEHETAWLCKKCIMSRTSVMQTMLQTDCLADSCWYITCENYAMQEQRSRRHSSVAAVRLCHETMRMRCKVGQWFARKGSGSAQQPK